MPTGAPRAQSIHNFMSSHYPIRKASIWARGLRVHSRRRTALIESINAVMAGFVPGLVPAIHVVTRK
jgi:hypothetical protein